MKQDQDTILIIDGSSLFFRAFYALPLLKTKRGLYTNAVYGFVSMMENAVDLIDPEYLLVCFDQKGRTFRNDLYEEYKGTRQKTPSELDQQWPYLMKILESMRIKTVDSPDYEADDLAGTVAKLGKRENKKVYLLTGDRDYFQLIEDDVRVLMTKKGITNMEIYDAERIREEYELTPEQLIDLKGLMGDSSDNIPGVPGIGEKTGIKLLKEFETLEGVYDHIDEVSGKKRKENLEEFRQQAFLSKKLGTIVTDMPLDFGIEDLKRKPYDLDTLRDLYAKYEFFTLMKRLPGEASEVETVEVEDLPLKNMDEALSAIRDAKNVMVHVVCEEKPYRGGSIEYLLLSTSDAGSIVKQPAREDLLKLKPLLEDDAVAICGIDLKDLFLYAFSYGIEPRRIDFDAAIAEYLLDPAKSNYEASHLIGLYENKTVTSPDDFLGKGKKKKTALEAEEAVCHYLSEIHHYLPKVMEAQREKLVDLNMWDLFSDIEMPLVETLASMEFEGVACDEAVLDAIGDDLKGQIASLEEAIYTLAGEAFNINSPKQLSEILFEKLGLQPIKKTKTGYSTNQEVLEKLRDEHEIVDAILNYRQLSKIQSTYVEGLKAEITDDGKIHSTFQQTITATGRISSTDPNLQNIPIKTEAGRAIRKAFVAKEGHRFIDADYSQIELRILAHVSGDDVMRDAFNRGADIHATTASQVFHTDPEEVTKLMRSRAKAVNFGIVYGISDYGLSRDLDIPRKEAKVYIDNYLKRFSGVHQFMEDIVEVGKAQGYVETLFHRRRYIPELSAKNFSVRSFGERVALNMPIQGTAADMIKKAMVSVYTQLKEKNLKSKLLLQVHDELIVEAPDDEADEVKKLLIDTMESALPLSIPVRVEVETGENWYESK
ncbi:MAG: DNA polymerase I [Peptoniphilus sp.]|nr:DNA polymerase I [Peptoniphilus sp.]MDD7363318.1 DNA polymerase I [Bacillota bacterium]MDY6044049.1 DNA polymerase I [Peptoniphilus sp.]